MLVPARLFLLSLMFKGMDKSLFVPGRPFQLSLIFVGKTRSLLKSGAHLKGATLG